MATEHGIAYLPWGPLAAKPFAPEAPLASSRGALAWLLRRAPKTEYSNYPPTKCTIKMGAETRYTTENAGVGESVLPPSGTTVLVL